ncbi:hypothetical protein GDO81_022419 [Engystomops pustulosus]|uniref:Uncharacterized protein n=1 Tax=Engystomops pustulosus TaxID=76066 RepID=A0AAV6ZDA4_ENGPU|nr:hypothetical protein GDO81_022419 [Engystomops pustulosus]
MLARGRREESCSRSLNTSGSLDLIEAKNSGWVPGGKSGLSVIGTSGPSGSNNRELVSRLFSVLRVWVATYGRAFRRWSNVACECDQGKVVRGAGERLPSICIHSLFLLLWNQSSILAYVVARK